MNKDVVFLCLGSNVGRREWQIDRAISALRGNGLRIVRCSSLYETQPVGIEEQSYFLNVVLAVNTDLEVHDLLAVCKQIEQALGRRESELRFGPRTIDIDILLYKELVIEEANLVIPHPRMTKRRFVLVPLVEIAPMLKDPRDKRTYRDILAQVNNTRRVTKLKAKES
jgi:2-amino-4-hydroxy-6-hydroxymethyldihydropteridine diphosphokinase